MEAGGIVGAESSPLKNETAINNTIMARAMTRIFLFRSSSGGSLMLRNEEDSEPSAEGLVERRFIMGV